MKIFELIKRKVVIATFLFAFSLCAFAGDQYVRSTERRDIVRKALDLYEVTVPTANGDQRFGLTIFEVQEQEVFPFIEKPGGITFLDQSLRAQLRRALLGTVRDWWDQHLSGGDLSSLTPGFIDTLHEEHSFFVGKNSILVLSDPDDFTNILAMIRIAKPSVNNPLVPLQRQFKDTLKPLPYSPLIRVPNNIIRIYSFANEDPYGIEIQNATVYEGDLVELKHYGAVKRRGVDLPAVLFHAAQEQGLFAVSRFEEGSLLGLPRGNVLITPRFVVAESDTPEVIALLLAANFTEHQTYPGTIRPERETKVLLGTLLGLNEHFRQINSGRRKSTNLPFVKIVAQENEAFIRRFLGPACSAAMARSTAKLHVAAQEKLRGVLKLLNLN